MAEPEYSRTEPATPFKRSEAHKRGQVAKSLDVNTFVVLGGFCATLAMAAPAALNRLALAWERLFDVAAAAGGELPMASALGEVAAALLFIMLPLAAVGLLLAIAANVAQTGPVFSAEPLRPQASRLNPFEGLKRIYNRRVLVEGMKAILKLAALATVVGTFLERIWPTLPDVLNLEPGDTPAWLAVRAKALVLRILLVLLIVALLDLLWSRWQYARQLRMSRRELKEEIKRREGDPLIRQRVRELQRENLKQARSLGRVADADVLITNPTHVAVALSYHRASMQAPTIVARGADLWAEEMKAQARRSGVVILERRALARLLYKRGVVDRPIPVESYLEVAQLYAELPRRGAATVRAAVGGQPGRAPR